MNELSPLDALAAELGGIAGRAERELRLEVRALVAELHEELALLKAARAECLAAIRAADARVADEHNGEITRTFAAVLAEAATRVEREVRLDVQTLVTEHRERLTALKAQAADVAAAALAADGRVAAALGQLHDGEPGHAGPQGPPGPEGSLRAAVEWDGNGIFYAGDVVTHLGATWQAAVDTGKEPPHTEWTCLAAAGRDGVGLAVCGTWSEAQRYRALDVVVRDGGSFVARIDEPGPCPGDGWQLMSRQGKAGPAGARGDRGDAGPAGPPGARAVALTADAEGLLTLSLDDGSTIECDLYPLLAAVR